MVMEKRNAAKSPYVNRPGQGWSGEGDDPGTYTVQAPDLQERSPDDVPLFRPEIRRHGPGNGKAPGQGDLGPYALPGTADRNVLNEKNDPHDDDWS
jgi:hypothetical protein